uniref:golgin subfamily A member 6-like protein 7 n=1 Tax=Osmia lignaria TaxID=473952 RepID=UPI0014780ED3|nr:golgin subfamily A member 6-like protein 7 [Osmia lignaria]
MENQEEVLRELRGIREEVRNLREEIKEWRLERGTKREWKEKQESAEEIEKRGRGLGEEGCKKEEEDEAEGGGWEKQDEGNEKVVKREREVGSKEEETEGQERKKERNEKELGQEVEIKRATERVGEGGRNIVLTELEEEDRKKEMVWTKNGIWDRWRVAVDEDLSKEERRMKWRIKEKAREERRKGNWVEFNNRRIWIEGEEWKWNEREEKWEASRQTDRK